MTDLELVQDALAGDPSAWSEIYNTQYPKIAGLCRNMLGPQHVEDVTQEVFVLLITKLHTFSGRSKLSTWVYRLAFNRMLEIMRKDRAKMRSGIVVELKEDHAIGWRNLPVMVRIKTAMERLTPGDRQLLILHYVNDYTQEEIGEMLGITEACAKSRINRARENARKTETGVEG